ncbi:MAG TPA: hypothetical protein VGN72_21595 [Tepidisphaeraceae bacterium]|jgi:hypothetical protein|nr:hypothetical protein [Tepidisphaeraceae bacterium]
MRQNYLAVAAALSLAAIVGCDRSETTDTVTPATPTTPAPAPAAENTTNDMNNAANATGNAVENAGEGAANTASGAVDAAGNAADRAGQAIINAGTEVRNAGSEAKDAAADSPADSTGVTGTAASAQNEAETLITQATQYVRENKMEMADQAMAKLEGMQAQMPEALKPRYQQLKTMYNTAKAGGGVTAPGM